MTTSSPSPASPAPPGPAPDEHLQALMRRYPKLGQSVMGFLDDRGRDLPAWPAWCFLPMAAWLAIAGARHERGAGPDMIAAVQDSQRLAALGTWRYTQGIYRFDADFLAALQATPLRGAIPCDVLYRLPQWAVYIETPGATVFNTPLAGYWAHLEWDANTGRHELRFLFNTTTRPDTGLWGFPLHLGAWTVTEGIDRAVAEARRHAPTMSESMSAQEMGARDIGHEQIPVIAAELNQLIAPLLYLCGDAPEIDAPRAPGTFPGCPTPRKTKRGAKLIPAPHPTVWRVGDELGATLRQSTSAEPAGNTDTADHTTGRTVRAHVRRGHWHGYWTGPRAGERRFVLKWLTPMLVGGHEPDCPSEEGETNE